MNIYPKILLIMLLSTLTMAAQNTTGTTALTYSTPRVPESVTFCGKEIGSQDELLQELMKEG